MINKAVSIILALLLLFSFVLTGCASHREEPADTTPEAALTEEPTAEPTEEPTGPACRVYTFAVISDAIKDPHFDYEQKEIHTVDESKVGTKKTVEFLGKEFELTYVETVRSKLDDVTCFKYSINGSEKDHVLLLPDDSVYVFVMHFDNDPIIKLGVSEADDPEEVRATVENVLKDEIDFSRFGSHEVTRTGYRADGSGYGAFTLSWYNTKGEYRTRDRAEVFVNTEGAISIIKLFFRAFTELDAPDDVKVEDYSSAIDEKLRELYSDKYTGYEIQSVRWTQVEGKAGLYLQVSANYMNGDYEDGDFVEMFIEILP